MTETSDSKSTSRGRRRLLWIVLAAVVIVIVAAVLVVPRLIDVERHRGRIEQALRDSTGWEPELGRIRLSLLRGLALEVAPVSLVAPEAGSRIDVDRLAVAAAAKPLLRGRLEVRSVVLDTPSIRLVRPGEERGWVVPAVSAGSEVEPPGGEAPGSGRISVDSIELRNGELRLEDRAVEPGQSLHLTGIDLAIRPSELTLQGSAGFAGSDGRVALEGAIDGPVRLTLDAVATDVLVPFVGQDVLRPGGTIAGTIELRLPDEIEGRLEATRLHVLDGERPMESAQVRFVLRSEDGGWIVRSLVLESGGVEVHGEGSLTPRLALTLEIPEAPLGPVMDLARAVFPVPLELESPGSAGATIVVDTLPDGELSFEATGQVSATGFRAADFLPDARDLRSRFALSRAGALTVTLLDGTVAGGALRGTLHLDSIDSPAPLVFEGELLDAAFGQLLDGFVDRAGERIGGPAALSASVELDLGQDPLDARALRGSLGLSARELTLPGWDLEAALTERIREKLGKLAGVAAQLDSKLADKLGLGSEEEAPGEGAVATVRELLESLSAEVDFNQIPWALESFRIEAGGLAAAGAGHFDPLTGEVDVRVSATLDEDRTRALVARYPEVKLLVGSGNRLTVPLEVQGSMIQPRIRADLDSLTRNKLGGQEPKEAVKGLLKDLLKRERDKRRDDD